MYEISFWKDKEKTRMDAELYSTRAEALAKKLASDCLESRRRKNKRTQIRKFYDEVTRLDMQAKSEEWEWEDILPLVHMLVAKAAYAQGRELVSDNFVDFMRSSINNVDERKDLAVFANFFEAFMGFYRLHCPAN